VLIVIMMASFGCAVQQKPQGGPRDRTPPKLLKATPLNLTHNFSATRIQLDFDEYFKLTNQFQEITVFPGQERPPDIHIKQKSLIITFKDTLQKNTTYVINFGKAIADVNEGNVLKNFTYVFSTGNHIDSLSLSGSVTNQLTQKREKDVTVFLFTPKQDSLLFGKKKPSIYATTDTAGNFVLNNLKEGVYKIYALQEKGPNKIYDNDDELIAFTKKPISLYHDTTGVKLNLFKQEPPKLRFVDRRFDLDGKMLFVFNKPIDNPSVRILSPAGLDPQKVVDISKTRDTVLVYSKNMDFDSVGVAFYSNNKPVDTAFLHKGRKEAYTRNVSVGYSLTKSATALKPGTDLHLYSNLPVASYDASLISLKQDSTFVNYTLSQDTGSTKNLTMKYRWRAKANYTLTINEGAVTDIYGDKNKKQIKKFVLDNPENYSQLTLKITVPDSVGAYVVELLLNDQKTPLRTDRVTKSTSLVYRNYPTGKYTVRVIYDTNKNGKWDPGNLKLKTQPENIWINDKIIDLRPNWELEEPVNIPKEVISP
jgi:uncharacterized protein (DUF2141 family)